MVLKEKKVNKPVVVIIDGAVDGALTAAQSAVVFADVFVVGKDLSDVYSELVPQAAIVEGGIDALGPLALALDRQIDHLLLFSEEAVPARRSQRRKKRTAGQLGDSLARQGSAFDQLAQTHLSDGSTLLASAVTVSFTVDPDLVSTEEQIGWIGARVTELETAARGTFSDLQAAAVARTDENALAGFWVDYIVSREYHGTFMTEPHPSKEMYKQDPTVVEYIEPSVDVQPSEAALLAPPDAWESPEPAVVVDSEPAAVVDSEPAVVVNSEPAADLDIPEISLEIEDVPVTEPAADPQVEDEWVSAAEESMSAVNVKENQDVDAIRRQAAHSALLLIAAADSTALELVEDAEADRALAASERLAAEQERQETSAVLKEAQVEADRLVEWDASLQEREATLEQRMSSMVREISTKWLAAMEDVVGLDVPTPDGLGEETSL